EVLRVAVDEGVLFRDMLGRWHVALDSGEESAERLYEGLPLPGSVRELVVRRLARLSEPARRAVEAAAVLGRETPESLSAGVAGLSGDERLEAVEEALVRQVLEDAPGDRLRFAHDKLREVAYERMAEERRRGLHLAAAEALERDASRAPELYAVLA